MIGKLAFFLGLIFLVFFLNSCSEEDVRKKRNIFPLEAGNYWVYRTVITSPDDVVSVFPYLDSVWIEKDTIIDGYPYWLQRGTLSGDYYIRDSADCVILRQQRFERIIYSTNRDTLFSRPPVFQVITDINSLTEVPAGEFRTINCRTLIRSNSSHSEFPRYDKNFFTAEQYICSSNVGMVKNISYYVGATIEVELVRYKLK